MKRTIALILALVCIVGIFAGCSKTKKMEYGKHTVMLDATSKSSTVGNKKDDYWICDHWTLYYDGTVEFYSEFNISKKQNISTWKVSEESLLIIHDILESNKTLTTDAALTKGSYWVIEYKSENGSQISKFEGFIDNNEGYSRLTQMLTPMPS